TIAAPCNPSSPTLPGMVPPIFDYGHGPNGAAIIGGNVYRGPLYATLYGRYFFADFVTQQVWSCLRSGSSITDLQEHTSILNPNAADLVAFGEDGKAALYIVELGGTIARITDPASPLVDSDGDGIPDLYETGTGIYVSPTDTGTNPDA